MLVTGGAIVDLLLPPGTAHVPLMSILVSYERTLSYKFMLPLMLACMTGYVIDQRMRCKSAGGKKCSRTTGRRITCLQKR